MQSNFLQTISSEIWSYCAKMYLQYAILISKMFFELLHRLYFLHANSDYVGLAKLVRPFIKNFDKNLVATHLK